MTVPEPAPANTENASDVVAANPDIGGQVRVKLSEDRMAAYLIVTSPQGAGRPAAVDDALAALVDAGVTFGIDHDAIQAAVTAAQVPVEPSTESPVEPVEPPEPVLVAQGRLPVDGGDATVVYHHGLRGDNWIPPVRADGTVDYFDLGLVHNVTRDTVLATKTPGAPGVPGCNVQGREVPARVGRDIPLGAGGGTELSADGLRITAAVDGHVNMTGHRIAVAPVYEVKRNVDATTGNLHFVGAVVIQGSIAAGFHVRAEGDVEVRGSVEGGTVEGTNILVRGGILGGTRGVIRAKGNVRARFLENADIRAGGSVHVNAGILHSQVDAEGQVEVTGRPGSIIGGRIRAREGIGARVVGSELGAATELAVGTSPNLRELTEDLALRLAEREGRLVSAAQALRLLSERERLGTLTPERDAMRQRLLASRTELVQEIDATREQLAAAERALQDPGNAWVRVHGEAHVGVRIAIGKAVYEVPDTLRRVRFVADQSQEVRIASFE